ncbi:MAG: HAMP domain-containing sensor histidine kinase [Balneolaceae bacterium]
MKIRTKLAWTFILLLIFGITAISSYSILFIRNYLIEEGKQRLQTDALLLSGVIESFEPGEGMRESLRETASLSGYLMALYASDGERIAYSWAEASPPPTRMAQAVSDRLNPNEPLLVTEPDGSELLVAWVLLGDQSNGHYLATAQYTENLYQPIHTIRWIIYSGMFISIGLVILVSIWFARYISRPILELEEAAGKIADGDTGRTLELNRRDEFGTLAGSLNRMASRLRDDRARMERLYESRNQLFADITHELRNPVHTVSGALEMLQLEELSEARRKHYLQTAVRQTERIARLCRDLVSLQRYDSDDHFIEKREFRLSGLLTRLYEIYYPEVRKKEIGLEIDTAPWLVYADPDKIEQVLDNLLSNALKYTTEGFIAVRCSAKGGEASIEVIDTGIGIREEHLDRLFDRFYRTDKARSRDRGGTGLGLSVVKSILQAHGSTIEVESAPGEGSRFTFRLPLAGSGQAVDSNI